MPVSQMFEKSLNVVAGYFGRGMLQKVLPVASGSKSYAVAGRCGYVNANGEWVHGAPSAHTGPAYFVFRGVNQPDVMNDGQAADGTYWWVSGNNTGWITCIPCTGGFELQTTEFDSAGTYNNGTALTVNSSGQLAPAATINSGTVIVGFCAPFTQYPENMRPSSISFGPRATNAYRVTVLNFYTWFIPRTT